MPSQTPPPPGVLFVNRVYPPDGGATGHYLREMAEGLAGRGWRVGVLVTQSVPGTAEAETVNGVAVRRVPVLPFTRGSIVRRLACYASAYLALLWRLGRMPLPEVVVVKTDPPLLVTLGAVIARLRGRRLVHWSQDLYPEVAEALGALGRFRLAGGLLRSLSTRALGACGRVVAIGRCMAERPRARRIASDRIAVVPNWAEPDLIRPAPGAGRRFRHEQGWDDRFVVMYSGNLGLAHPFDGLLAAAAAAGTTAPDLLFAIIGDGARMAEVRAKVADRRLDNVRFLPMQPRGMLPETLAAADAHVVLMEPSLSGLLVPSKVYNVLASGRPCPSASTYRSPNSYRKIGCGAGSTPIRAMPSSWSWVRNPQCSIR